MHSPPRTLPPRPRTVRPDMSRRTCPERPPAREGAAAILGHLRRLLAAGWSAPSPEAIGEAVGVSRATAYRHLRALETAGAIVRERRRVAGRLRTGWRLPARDAVAEALGVDAPTRGPERARAAAVVRREGVARVREVARTLAGLPTGRATLARAWTTRRGWTAAERAVDAARVALGERLRSLCQGPPPLTGWRGSPFAPPPGALYMSQGLGAP